MGYASHMRKMNCMEFKQKREEGKMKNMRKSLLRMNEALWI